MEALFANVNWLAVGVSTIISFMGGALWYSEKMFGTKWAEGVRISIGPDAKQPVAALTVQFIGTLLLAWVVALALVNGGEMGLALITVTFFVLLVASGLFAQHSLYAALTEGVFFVVMTGIMVLCNLFL